MLIQALVPKAKGLERSDISVITSDKEVMYPLDKLSHWVRCNRTKLGPHERPLSAARHIFSNPTVAPGAARCGINEAEWLKGKLQRTRLEAEGKAAIVNDPLSGRRYDPIRGKMIVGPSIYAWGELFSELTVEERKYVPLIMRPSLLD